MRAAGVGEPTRGDTVHLDVVDREGNMVAATPSGGWLWGAPVIESLGFPLGTRAQMFWLEEGLPNTLAPGKRPRTTLSPTLVLRAGEPSLAIGTPGGDQQDQHALHVLLGHLHFELDLQAAIDAPNHHTEAFPSSFFPREDATRHLALEDRAEASTVDGLRELAGHDLELAPPSVALGRVEAVGLERDGQLKAAANPRGMQGCCRRALTRAGAARERDRLHRGRSTGRNAGSFPPRAGSAPARARGAAREMTAGAPSAPDHEAIAEADARRYRALLEEDFDVLNEVLSDDLVYVHSTSAVDSKESYLATLGTDVHYRSAHVEDSTIRRLRRRRRRRDGGRVTLVYDVKGSRRTLHNRFVTVWARRAGTRRQLVHWQSSPIPCSIELTRTQRAAARRYVAAWNRGALRGPRFSSVRRCPKDLESLRHLGQDLDVAVGAMDANPLPIPDQLRSVLHPDDSRQAVFARDHRAVGHEPSDLGHEAFDRDEQWRPTRICIGGDQDVSRLEIGVRHVQNDAARVLDRPGRNREADQRPGRHNVASVAPREDLAI